MQTRLFCLIRIMLLLAWTSVVFGQVAQEPPPAQPELVIDLPDIADEPRTVDPASLMPAPLTVRATVDLSDASLSELINWLRDKQGLVVLLKRTALADVGLLASEPISDSIDDEPLYLLLDRLRALDLGWYYENDVLYITSAVEVEDRLATLPYNLGDLLDAEYDVEDLALVITSTVAPESWNEVGGAGALSFIGDVMFVRQTDSVQREVQGLLAALRNHARQTFILDPPQHLALREKLEENVSVEFLDTPLETVIEELAKSAAIDMRLDLRALRAARIRQREPITVRLSERKLKTVLQAMLMDLHLSWVLRDGVLWITTQDEANSLTKTAVYDVRDLCRDQQESDALYEAVTSQTDADMWDNVGGPGTLEFAKPGTMVVRNQENILMAVLELLETYRAALRVSKPRARDVVDPQEVITVYYRTHAEVAAGLVKLLPILVAPASWKSDDRPGAPGEIFCVASVPGLLAMDQVKEADDPAEAKKLLTPRAVLIVTHTRATHEEVASVIRRVETGDPSGGAGGMGGMGGMGGFGGGFFSLPSKR